MKWTSIIDRRIYYASESYPPQVPPPFRRKIKFSPRKREIFGGFFSLLSYSLRPFFFLFPLNNPPPIVFCKIYTPVFIRKLAFEIQPLAQFCHAYHYLLRIGTKQINATQKDIICSLDTVLEFTCRVLCSRVFQNCNFVPNRFHDNVDQIRCELNSHLFFLNL